jgi:hypothetical protein
MYANTCLLSSSQAALCKHKNQRQADTISVDNKATYFFAYEVTNI